MKSFHSSIIVLLSLFFMGCTDRINERLSTQVAPLIESQYFEIVGGRDTTLISSHQSRFIIPASSFPEGKNIRIELKEVFTAPEIMLSGLATQSNGELLQSDGMFFFQASSNEKVIQPQSAIEIKMPASEVNVPMQLFSGAFDQNQHINWIDPKPIARSGVSPCLDAGRILFRNNCASCHHPVKDGTGPLLRGVRSREPWKSMPQELINWVNNPGKSFGGPAGEYLLDLRSKFGSIMTAFPMLTKEDINCIFEYMDGATSKMLEEDKVYFDTLTRIQKFTVSRFADTVDFDRQLYADILYPEYFDSTGQSFDNIAPAYEFTIEFNGWYNIDQYLKQNDPNLKPVQFTASIARADSFNFYNMWLLIPSEKIQTSLYPDENGIHGLGEGTKLPYGKRAIVFCIGDIEEDGVWYGIREVYIQEKQYLKLELKKTIPEKLKEVLKTFRIDGVTVGN